MSQEQKPIHVDATRTTMFITEMLRFDKQIADIEIQLAEVKRKKANFAYDTQINTILEIHNQQISNEKETTE